MNIETHASLMVQQAKVPEPVASYESFQRLKFHGFPIVILFSFFFICSSYLKSLENTFVKTYANACTCAANKAF